MPSDPLVSVIIPLYNAAPWIGAAVESAIGQSWPNLEVIVVDDGSTDGSLETARALASDRVTVLAQPNAGASAARNRGLSVARGDYVQYLDADDLLHRDKVAVQLARLAREPEGRLASGAWGRFVGEPESARFEPEGVWKDMDPVTWLVTSWAGEEMPGGSGGMMPNSAWLVPREVARRAGPWNEGISVNDDGEYFTRVLLASTGVAFCPDAYSYYRSGIGGSLSGRSDPDALVAYFRSLVLGIDALRAAEESPRVRIAAAAQLQRFIYSVYPEAPALVAEAEARLEALGGSPLPPPEGGRAFRLISRLAGWRAARRVQRAVALVRR